MRKTPATAIITITAIIAAIRVVDIPPPGAGVVVVCVVVGLEVVG